MAGKEEGSSRTVSVKRAAQLLGVSADQVRVLLRKGTLVGAKEGRDYAVAIDSVRLLLEEREAATEVRRRELHERLDRLAHVWPGPVKGPDQTC